MAYLRCIELADIELQFQSSVFSFTLDQRGIGEKVQVEGSLGSGCTGSRFDGLALEAFAEEKIK